MECCCGESYTVNEYIRPPGSGGRKKDKSFKSFITFMLVLLVIYLVIYSLLVTVVPRKKSYLEKSDGKPATDDASNDARYQTHGAAVLPSTTEYFDPHDVHYDESTVVNDAITTIEIIDDDIKLLGFDDTTEDYIPSTNNPLIIFQETETTDGQVDDNNYSHSTNRIIEALAASADGGNEEKITFMSNTDESHTLMVEPHSDEATKKSETDPLIAFIQQLNSQTLPTTTTTTVVTNDEAISVEISTQTEEANNNAIVKQQNLQQGAAPKLASINEEGNNSTCQSAECKAGAAKMLRIMDHSEDPCEDFYQFACGTAADSTPSAKINVLLKALHHKNLTEYQPIQTLFNSCVHYEYFTKTHQQVLLHISNINEENNLTLLLASLMLRQSTPLFEISYGFVSNEEGFGVQVLPPNSRYGNVVLKGWSLQSRIRRKCAHVSDYFNFDKHVDLKAMMAYDVYEKCLGETLKRLVEEFVAVLPSGPAQDTVVAEFLSFFQNKTNLTEIDIQDALLNGNYTKTNVEKLQKKYSHINWQVLFSKLIRNDSNQSLPVYLYLEEHYFANLMRALNKRLAENKGKMLLNILKLYYQLELFENIMEAKEDILRFCAEQAASLMPDIAENIFLEKSGISALMGSDKFGPMFEELKSKFYWLIDVSNLEEYNAKSKIKDAIKYLRLKFLNEIESSNYDKFGHDYLANVFLLLEDRRRIFLSQPSILSYQTEQFPIVIPNTAETIVIPNTFVYKTLQAKKMPSYIWESYVKFHLGRAIAKHLDQAIRRLHSSFYSQFLKGLNEYLELRDNENNWKGQEIRYKGNQKAWLKVVESSTLDRMADNLALEIAFQGTFPLAPKAKVLPWISDNYSPENQFFILIAQEYCESGTLSQLAKDRYELPGAFRVDYMMSNSQDFEVAFRCPRGSRMNPEEKMVFDVFTPQEEYIYEEVNK